MTSKRKPGMSSDRLMDKIRKRGFWWLVAFTLIFVVSVFAGLGVGSFTSGFGGNAGADGTTPTGPDGKALKEFKKVADIGDVTINWDRFYQMYSGYIRQLEASEKEAISPDRSLQALNEIVDSVISEEALRAYGKKHGIKIDDKEVRDKVAASKAQFAEPESQEAGSKTILGEFQRSLGTSDTSEQRWRDYLASQGWDETEFYKLTQDELLRQKIQTQIEDEITASKKVMVDAVKKAVDDELAAGTSFENLALLFSYDFYTRTEGGEIPSDLSLGLFSAKFDEEVWKLAKPGDRTPWFETEFGWEIVQLINRVPKEKAQTLEEMKTDLIAEIRKTKSDEKYNPTDDELKALYENKHVKMRVRHITLTTMPGYDFAIFQKKLVEANPMTIHHPLVKGYRAINGLVNERPAGVEPTVEARLFIPAEDYQVFEGSTLHADRVKEAIELAKAQKWPQEASWYKPAAGEPEPAVEETPEQVPVDAATEETGEPTETPAETDTADAAATPADSGQPDTAAPETDTEKKPGEGPYVSEPPDLSDKPGEPRYAEAAEAFVLAKDKLFKDQASAHYYVAWCYDKWLKDATYKKDLTITEDEAKKIIEDEYKEAISIYEFEPYYQLALAQFFTDQNRFDDALPVADKTLEYAGLNRTILGKLNGIYVKLGNTEKQKEVEAKIQTAQMREAEAQGQSQTFQVPYDTSGEPINLQVGEGGDAKTDDSDTPAPKPTETGGEGGIESGNG